MIMLNKEYMISHMRNEDGSIHIKNVVLAAASEAAELFQCMIAMDGDFADWKRLIDRLNWHLDSCDYEKIHDICQALYAMKHLTDELEGLYLAREDKEICALYCQVFIGMLDLILFSAEAMVGLNGGKNLE